MFSCGGGEGRERERERERGREREEEEEEEQEQEEEEGGEGIPCPSSCPPVYSPNRCGTSSVFASFNAITRCKNVCFGGEPSAFSVAAAL
jgi:hypothetical protein